MTLVAALRYLVLFFVPGLCALYAPEPADPALTPGQLYEKLYEFSFAVTGADTPEQQEKLYDLYFDLNGRPFLAQVFPISMEQTTRSGKDVSLLRGRCSLPVAVVEDLSTRYDEKKLLNFDTYAPGGRSTYYLKDFGIEVVAIIPATNTTYEFDVTLPLVITGRVSGYRIERAHMQITVETDPAGIHEGELIDGKITGYVHTWPTNEQKADADKFRSSQMIIDNAHPERLPKIPIVARNYPWGGEVNVRLLMYEDQTVEFFEFVSIEPEGKKFEYAAIKYLRHILFITAKYDHKPLTVYCVFNIPFPRHR